MTALENAEQVIARAKGALVRELTSPTEWVTGEIGAPDRDANRLADDLIEAAREVERQRHLAEPALRNCCVPPCLRQFDAMWSLTGQLLRPEWSGRGWRQLRLAGADHICPDHAPLLDEHTPQWDQPVGDRVRLTCPCGWSSPEAFWQGYAVAGWRDHLVQLGEQRAA